MTGSPISRNAAWRGAGTPPHSASSTARVAGPEMRMTATADTPAPARRRDDGACGRCGLCLSQHNTELSHWREGVVSTPKTPTMRYPRTREEEATCKTTPATCSGGETSPYLLQHKDNPVHWRPWGAAALKEARHANKPILLSVGYAACHWCHVMAHESFEDEATAAVMNELFVNIKVDREERPDVDAIYMAALHQLGEHGGWPLTMFLTPGRRAVLGRHLFPAARPLRPAGLRQCTEYRGAGVSRRARARSATTPTRSSRR